MLPEYKYKQIYNPKSNRLQNYDYGSNGGYFITICTKNRENYFGEIIDGKMILNEMGKITEKYYLEIIEHFTFVILDEFVIMPNHIHGIMIIDNEINPVNNQINPIKMLHCNVSIDDETEPVEMLHCNISINNENHKMNPIKMLQCNISINNENHKMNPIKMLQCNISTNNEYYSKISPKKGELGTIIRSFKSICTKTINNMQNKILFGWQSNYYDRIIRNEDELQRIRKYILENPLKWELDKNNNESLFM